MKSTYRKVMRASHSWPVLKPEKSNLPMVAEALGTAATWRGGGAGGGG